MSEPWIWDGASDYAEAAEHGRFVTLAALPAPADERRMDVIALAFQAFQGELTEVAALEALKEYAPALDEDERANRLGNLIAELEREQRIEDLHVDPEPGESREDLAKQAAALVQAAADKLIGDNA